MNRRSIQTIAIVLCALGLVYTLVVVQKDGLLQDVWAVISRGSFGGFPL